MKVRMSLCQALRRNTIHMTQSPKSMTQLKMRTNSLVRYSDSHQLIERGRSTVLSVPASIPKKIARTNNTVSLRVSKTSEKTLRGPLTSSKLAPTTTGETIVEEAAIVTTTTHRITLATAKVVTTRTAPLTTTETKASPKLTRYPNTNHGGPRRRSTLTFRQVGTRSRGGATTE